MDEFYLIESEISNAKDIIEQEINYLKLKINKNEKDQQSCNKFIEQFDEFYEKIKIDKQKHEKFLINVLLSKQFLDSKKVPLSDFRKVIEKLHYNNHFSYRAFTHFKEVRTIIVALNYEQWEEVINSIKIIKSQSRRNGENSVKTKTVTITVNNEEMRFEICSKVEQTPNSSENQEEDHIFDYCWNEEYSWFSDN